jgi:hypothetical protein
LIAEIRERLEVLFVQGRFRHCSNRQFSTLRAPACQAATAWRTYLMP